VRHIADRLRERATPDLLPPEVPGLSPEALRLTASERPIAFVTTDYLATLWDERSRQVDVHKEANPDDLSELERRQRLASQAMRAYRLLSELERQLGFELALPILGPRASIATSPEPAHANGAAEPSG
jgi:hypothetical protein